jgi:hypothetical protein
MARFSNESGVKSEKAEGAHEHKAVLRMKRNVDRRRGRVAGRK